MKITYEFDSYEDDEELKVYQQSRSLYSAVTNFLRTMEFVRDGSQNLVVDDDNDDPMAVPLDSAQADAVMQELKDTLYSEDVTLEF